MQSRLPYFHLTPPFAHPNLTRTVPCLQTLGCIQSKKESHETRRKSKKKSFFFDVQQFFEFCYLSWRRTKPFWGTSLSSCSRRSLIHCSITTTCPTLSYTIPKWWRYVFYFKSNSTPLSTRTVSLPASKNWFSCIFKGKRRNNRTEFSDSTQDISSSITSQWNRVFRTIWYRRAEL